MGCFVRGGRSSMGCFVRGGKNGMGCFVRGDKNCMGCFVRGGKLMRDVLSGVAKNGMGCFVPGCFVLHSRTPYNLIFQGGLDPYFSLWIRTCCRWDVKNNSNKLCCLYLGHSKHRQDTDIIPPGQNPPCSFL